MDRIIKAFFYSVDGIKAAWADEPAFRQECYALLPLVPLALWLAPDKISLILMVSSLLLVLICELINSGIEAITDKTGTEIHPLAKKAKDTGSAAVMIALINVGIVWAVALFF